MTVSQSQIKFKALDKVTKEFFIVSWISFGEKTLGDGNGRTWRFSDVHLMQYTGLKDKCGTEIYDRDIVMLPMKGWKKNCKGIKPVKCFVHWVDGAGGFSIGRPARFEGERYLAGNVITFPHVWEENINHRWDIRVVGSLYTDPELSLLKID